jgi:hypothetical protein
MKEEEVWEVWGRFKGVIVRVVVWTYEELELRAGGGKKGKLCRFTSRAGKCKSTCRRKNRWTGERTAWFERAQPCSFLA